MEEIRGFKRMMAKNVPPDEWVYVPVEDVEGCITRRYKYLLTVITKMFDVSYEDLTGKSREYPLPVYRTMVWCVLRDEGYGTKQIEKVVNRDHSTIVVQTSRFKESLKFDKKLSVEYEVFKSNVNKNIDEIMIYDIKNYKDEKMVK
jgi:hypothetical protein